MTDKYMISLEGNVTYSDGSNVSENHFKAFVEILFTHVFKIEQTSSLYSIMNKDGKRLAGINLFLTQELIDEALLKIRKRELQTPRRDSSFFAETFLEIELRSAPNIKAKLDALEKS